MPVAATPTIDTTNLLTILGVVAAAWAVISPTARLSFRLCMTRLDWMVIVTLVLAIHALVFEEVFRTLELYPAAVPWPWGLDKNGVVYLLFALLTAFVFWRSQTFRLSARKLPLFNQLTTSLLHARKFAELGELLSQHQRELLSTSQAAGYRARLAGWLAPSDKRKLEELALRLAKKPPTIPAPKPTAVDKWRERIASALRKQPPSDALKRAILKKLLSSHDLVAYLALAYPYLCLRAIPSLIAAVEDLQDIYFEVLLANTSSIFFSEIRNSQNLDGGSRVRLLAENQLVSFYCKDIRVAEKLGVYSTIGEAMLARVEADDMLASKLNKPLLRYDDKGKYSCPIYGGIYFLRIMVLEGLHQRVQDHLWVHYAAYLTDKILSRMRPLQADDMNYDYPTPFAYLLYSLVDVTTDLIEECRRVSDDGTSITIDQREGRQVFIAFEAAAALGGMMQSVLASDRASERLKISMLENILSMLRRLAPITRLEHLIHAVMAAIVNPYVMGLTAKHLDSLSLIYSKQDSRLRDDTKAFANVLADANGRLRRTASY